MPQLHEEAAEELAQAAAYYERRLHGLGDRFITEAIKGLSLISTRCPAQDHRVGSKVDLQAFAERPSGRFPTT